MRWEQRATLLGALFAAGCGSTGIQESATPFEPVDHTEAAAVEQFIPQVVEPPPLVELEPIPEIPKDPCEALVELKGEYEHDHVGDLDDPLVRRFLRSLDETIEVCTSEGEQPEEPPTRNGKLIHGESIGDIIAHPSVGPRLYKLLTDPLQRRNLSLYFERYEFVRDVCEAAYEAEGVWPALVFGLTKTETGIRVNQRSNKGALGLVQLMPFTAKKFGIDDPSQRIDVEQACGASARYMKYLLAEFNGNLQHALTGYIAGEGVVNHALDKEVDKHGWPRGEIPVSHLKGYSIRTRNGVIKIGNQSVTYAYNILPYAVSAHMDPEKWGLSFPKFEGETVPTEITRPLRIAHLEAMGFPLDYFRNANDDYAMHSTSFVLEPGLVINLPVELEQQWEAIHEDGELFAFLDSRGNFAAKPAPEPVQTAKKTPAVQSTGDSSGWHKHTIKNRREATYWQLAADHEAQCRSIPRKGHDSRRDWLVAHMRRNNRPYPHELQVGMTLKVCQNYRR